MKKQRKRKPKSEFIDDEAEVSDDGAVVSEDEDEDEDELTGSLASFVDYGALSQDESCKLLRETKAKSKIKTTNLRREDELLPG